ncbi:CFC_HP_G0070300.mRNA.1.CDS.1 [Saccharomyces cerevisiae]|nr:CFC_HP_G0070300.mRNA.1.CDS.1 [Saccharomyces cerevisiae]CAI6667072.1 CFC_HP_G0070300.mRNA.1.CDS.1 [Saccharomyces cerevisiae]
MPPKKSDSISTLQLAINGIDQFVATVQIPYRLLKLESITIMGGSNAISKKYYRERIWERAERCKDLQVDILQFLTSLQNSRDPEYFQEEVVKLNNGGI